MPAKIEHKTVNGKECKWCPKCKEWKELDEFHTTNHRTWDNRFYTCISCHNQKRNNAPMPNEVYRKMLNRCARDQDYLKRGTQVLISEADFCDWYNENWFKGCFVDRIDNQGHYEKGNIQTITRTEHNYKRRQDRLDAAGIKETDQTRYCFTCESLLPVDMFYCKKSKINKNNPMGLNEECSVCARQKRNQRYKEQKP